MNPKKKINLMIWTIDPILQKKGKKKTANIERGYKDIMKKKIEMKSTIKSSNISNNTLSMFNKPKKRHDKRTLTDVLNLSINSNHSKVSNNKSNNSIDTNTKNNSKSFIGNIHNNIITLSLKNKDFSYVNTSYDHGSKNPANFSTNVGQNNDIKTPTNYYNHNFTKNPQFTKSNNNNSHTFSNTFSISQNSAFKPPPNNFKVNGQNLRQFSKKSNLSSTPKSKRNHITKNCYLFPQKNTNHLNTNNSTNINPIFGKNDKSIQRGKKNPLISSTSLNRSTDDIKSLRNTFDDADGNYLYKIGEFLTNRYEIISHLGKGSFGQAVKCYDHFNKEYVCIKIIKNKPKFKAQAQIEIKILKYLNSHDTNNYSNIVTLKNYFIYREHICLVFELLSSNLYEVLKGNKYIGFDLDTIKIFTTQILFSLLLLKKYHIIHCDLKPENILLITNGKTGIKLIDFGSSCFSNEKLYTYIQSRFYRAPEILLGMNYDIEIDIWSLGCIICELFTGYPIFPGENEYDMLYYIMEYFGVPPREMIENSEKKLQFFDKNCNVTQKKNSFGKIRKPETKLIENFLDGAEEDFIDFVKRCLVYEPEMRIKPEDALKHKWITGEMPREVLKTHMRKIKEVSENNMNFAFNIHIDLGETVSKKKSRKK